MIIPFTNAQATNINLCGGKGCELAKLLQAGFPIPEGFIISSLTFTSLLHQLNIIEPLTKLLVSTSNLNLQTIENTIYPLQQKNFANSTSQ